ncbi:Kinesin-like protein kif19 [Terramyces sp. JEL0728]|nr:Kinesin-like protein kif19 [Terramyces sp. JEL0728]
MQIPQASKLRVAVRIRPLTTKERAKISNKEIAKTIMIYDPTDDFFEGILRKERKREKVYNFDFVFGEQDTQGDIFEMCVKEQIEAAMNGYNATVFAYGATGAGKTYTMMGTESKPGIMYLTLNTIFQKISDKSKGDLGKYKISISYLEIYNEKIRDLLVNKSENLELQEDSTKGVLVAGISYLSIQSLSKTIQVLRKGNRNRIQESTGANVTSSRSHAILQIFISHKSPDKVMRFSKLSLIDLAGSGMRMIEGANINKSLLALGNCINSLSDSSPKKQDYINYRDSKLTRLLKDSLGGNCKTCMIANISPFVDHFEETLNTLKYASRARNIKTKLTQKAESYSAILNEFQLSYSSKTFSSDHTLLVSDPDQSVSDPTQLDTFQEMKAHALQLKKMGVERAITVQKLRNQKDLLWSQNVNFEHSKQHKTLVEEIHVLEKEENKMLHQINEIKANLECTKNQSEEFTNLEYTDFLIALDSNKLLNLEINDETQKGILIEKDRFYRHILKLFNAYNKIIQKQEIVLKNVGMNHFQDIMDNKHIISKITAEYLEIPVLKQPRLLPDIMHSKPRKPYSSILEFNVYRELKLTIMPCQYDEYHIDFLSISNIMGKFNLEICLENVESAIAAEKGGAIRVELCANLLEGGTTPSKGLISVCKANVSIPIHVMIRPRGGDFHYSAIEFDIMKEDILLCKEIGVAGVVFGILLPNGSVDIPRCKELVELAKPMNVTFHRAFDVAKEPFEALESIISIGGIQRILSSGQESSVLEGVPLLKQLIQIAGERIRILPGAGITERNIYRIYEQLKVNELHLTASYEVESDMQYRNHNVYMGFSLSSSEYSLKMTDGQKVKKILNNQ